MNGYSKRVGRTRNGFTLVEIVVVIAIIVTLIGLLLPAIQKAREMVRRTQAMADISQLSVAIGSAKSTMEARYVPGRGAATADFNQFFGPRYAGGTPSISTGSQALVFFLGGYNGSAYGQGFNTNAQNPYQAGSASNPIRSPFYEFPTRRLNFSTGVPAFNDPWGTPYAYMTTKNGTGDYPPSGDLGVLPLLDANGKAVNFNSFQIISAGTNKTFGSGGSWVPGQGSYAGGAAGADDLSNFSDKVLGSQ